MAARHLFPMGVGALLLATSGCGERAPATRVVAAVLDTVYAEPATTHDPLLLMPRDLCWQAGRIYVLDGRTARVGVLDPESGRLLGDFGGLGEGPGELGRFPYALVAAGDRIGVGHGGSVSWFTLEGGFLGRDPLPPHDLGTPSLLRLEGGWLANVGYRGPDGPVALYTDDDGDTTRFGRAVEPSTTGRSGAAGSGLNAVHVGRFAEGGVLLAWVHHPWVDLHRWDGTFVRRVGGSGLPDDLERRDDGRLRASPGYVLSAASGADGRVYLVDGTFRDIRVFTADGREPLRFRVVSGGVLKVTADPGGTLWAIGLEDVVYRVRPLAGGTAGPGAHIGGPSPRPVPGPSPASSPERPAGPDGTGGPPPWLGRRLSPLLGSLVTLEGDPVAAGTGEGLRLHLLVADRECLACLEEIPRLALRLEELGHSGLPARVVALGDRFEARRTLWGLDRIWPVVVSPRTDLPARFGFEDTPLRVITLDDRVLYVDQPPDRDRDPEGTDPLEEALAVWRGRRR